MEIQLVKGKVLTHISCSSFSSNNLYCENIKSRVNNDKKTYTISLDYSKQFKNKNSDRFDFDCFLRGIKKLILISIRNDYLFEKFSKSFMALDQLNDYAIILAVNVDNEYLFKINLGGTEKGKLNFNVESYMS